MSRILILKIFLWMALSNIKAQDNVYPAKPQSQTIVIKNGTIHTISGHIINQGAVVLKNGKIASVGADVKEEAGAMVIDAKGKNIYPGLILANTDLGLREITSGVRGSNDFRELGDYNTEVQSLVAYNADSRIINTLRTNGILLACVIPQGSLLAGTASVVQLDAWNWQDAVYKSDNALYLDMPSLMKSPRRSPFQPVGASDPIKEGLKTLKEVDQFFTEAKSYLGQEKKENANLKFEALRPLFEKKQKLFVHADISRQILLAIDLKKKHDVDMVIVGGSESYLLADLLRQNNIPVILNSLHALPTMQDDDVDQPFKTPAILQKAGVLFAINDDSDNARYRNLSFNAGTAVAYGLTKEQALASITLNAAKILGIDHQTSSIEVGKDANLIICDGDLLDMRSSTITDAFIQGRKIDLSNKQTQLYERYMHRYGLN